MIEPFTIDSEAEADDYLHDLLAKDEYRSMDEVASRAQRYIRDNNIRNYFITKAKEILGST